MSTLRCQAAEDFISFRVKREQRSWIRDDAYIEEDAKDALYLYCTPSTGNGQHPREDLQGEITPGRREREPGWMTNPMDNVTYIIV